MKFSAHAVKKEQAVTGTRDRPPLWRGECVVVIPEANAAKNTCSSDN